MEIHYTLETLRKNLTQTKLCTTFNHSESKKLHQENPTRSQRQSAVAVNQDIDFSGQQGSMVDDGSTA